jgi:hypothetical protein
MWRLSARERAGENTTVSTHRHMAPPEAYRGEKWVSMKPLNHALMSCVLISLNMSNLKVTCGERKVTAVKSSHATCSSTFHPCNAR